MLKIKKDNTLLKIFGFFLVLLVAIIIKLNIIFVFLLLISAFLNYRQGKMELPFDLTPSFTFLLLFSIKFGFGHGILFLFFGSVIPSIISRGFDHMTFLFVGLAIGMSYLASLELLKNPILYGFILLLIQSIFAFIIAKLFAGEPSAIFSVFLGLVLNTLYLLIFSELLFNVLSI